MDKPRIRVDFNELIQNDLVLLSQTNIVSDSDGNELLLSEGLPVSIYEFNDYKDGTDEYLFADGVAERNDPKENGDWTKIVKWCCRINKNGITSKIT